MSKRKKIWLVILGFLLLLNGLLIFTGHSYLYKGIWNTYLKGRSKPGIDEYQIFHNREVKAGNHQPWALSKHYNSHTVSANRLQEVESYRTVAFLVIQNDSILYERYWDDYGEASYTNSFSIAKTICSILTGIAIKEGKIASVEDLVGDYLEEYATGDRAKIKIKHLLTMSSGISFDESYSGPFAFPAKAYYGTDLKELVGRYDVVRTPGEIFNYQSGTNQLLGFVLEKATGMSLSEYASQKLWQPIGARYSAWWSLDDEEGHEKAYCCFNSNARDFARLGQLYLNKGNWKGRQVVPQDYAEQSVQVADLLEKDGQPTTRYGYSWWIYNYKGRHIYYARGILGQYVFVIPEEDMVIVRLGHDRADNPKDNPPDDVFTWLNTAFEIAQVN